LPSYGLRLPLADGLIEGCLETEICRWPVLDQNDLYVTRPKLRRRRRTTVGQGDQNFVTIRALRVLGRGGGQNGPGFSRRWAAREDKDGPVRQREYLILGKYWYLSRAAQASDPYRSKKSLAVRPQAKTRECLCPQSPVSNRRPYGASQEFEVVYLHHLF